MIDKLTADLCSRRDSYSNTEMTKLYQTHDTNVCALREKLCDRQFFIDCLQSPLKVGDDSEEGPYGELQKHITLCYGTQDVASIFSILLVICNDYRNVRRERIACLFPQICSALVGRRR